MTTLNNIKIRIRNIKRYSSENLLLNKLDTKYMQIFINKLSDIYSQNQVTRQLEDMKGAIKYAVKFYNYPNEYLLTNVKIPKRRKQ